MITTSSKSICAIATVVVLVAIGFWFAQRKVVRQKNPVDPPAAIASQHLPIVLLNLTDPTQPWQRRIDQLRSKSVIERSEAEIIHLYQLLSNPAPRKEASETWYLIANEIMIELGRHDRDVQRFTTRMLALAKDDSQPLVIRDYAIQHLITWVHTQWASPSEIDISPKPSIAFLLEECAALAIQPDLQESSLPGTTLMMLMGLCHLPQAAEGGRSAIITLKPWLLSVLAENSHASETVRVSALQAVAAFAPEDFRETIRRYAFAEASPLALQLPAIAALARCGQLQDVPKLQQLADKLPALQFAANKASQTLLGNQKSTISQ